MHSLKSLVSTLSLIAPLVSAQIGGTCHDPVIYGQPNPIAQTYPNQNTGTLNSTLAIVPISYSLARSLIPSQYRILKKQYKQWLPSLPNNQYPALVELGFIHDVYNKGVSAGSAGDYQRAAVSFPFVDRLGDGYTAMTYNQQVIISSANTAAQSAATQYGYNVSAGYFATCNAYEYENFTSNLALPPNQRGTDQAAWANWNTDLSNPDIAHRMLPASSPYSMNFWYNVTNQPLFSTGTTCDKFVRTYNTDLTLPPYSAVMLQGNASALALFFGSTPKTVWENVYGVKLDVAFHDTPNVACSSLKGFHVINAPAATTVAATS